MLANRLRAHRVVSSGLIIPDVRALGLVGHAPVVSQSTALVVQPGTGVLGFVGISPTLPAGSRNFVPATRSLSATGKVPTVTAFVVSASSVRGDGSGGTPRGPADTTGSYPNPVIVGGSGLYGYLWTFVSDNSGNGTAAISGASTLNPVWSKTGIFDGFDIVNTWKLTVTDMITTKQTSTTITVTLTWTYYEGGGGP